MDGWFRSADDITHRKFHLSNIWRSLQLMMKVCVVSFSPDQVGADGRVEEGEDGGESQIRS